MSTTNVIKNEQLFSVSHALLSFKYKCTHVIFLSRIITIYFFIIAIKSYLTDFLFIYIYCFNVCDVMTR